ncbi:MAG TPA: pyridoxamine 5'-phosphate oxidase family protein [Acidimicrobiales bacterium]|nr:pyridoxamine 5'-phosphate oxidase family protein [Acidimicrobiales bacterium]
MALLDARTWMEHLGSEECWTLLGLVPVGRLGVVVDGLPEIFPVNFVVDDEAIVFRTDSGSKLAGLAASPGVCFEVDGIDLDDRTGWSVLVKGRAKELGKPEDVSRASRLPLEFWSVGEKAHWVRIEPTQVTGRRVHHVAPDST